ncbi:MAG: AAA family ATPase [Oribacterium sp.]|nr:AAA family ATPase [Oribacterium sp.]
MSYINEKYANQLAPKMTLKDVSGFRTYPIQPSEDDWMEETYHEDFTMQNIVKFLDTEIIGNEDVKRCIAKALYMGFEYHVPSNLLIIGPSGSGKSLTMEALAKEWPRACGTIVNASLLTSEGYRGDVKIRQIISELKSRTTSGHHTFVQIDEFDKIVDNVGDYNYSLRVQDELLLYMSHIGETENVYRSYAMVLSLLFMRNTERRLSASVHRTILKMKILRFRRRCWSTTDSGPN